MPKMVYQWGSQSYAVKPQVVGEAVERIENRDGFCQPRALVDEARKKTSPLHPLFTWDDVKAADQWRNHEARQVIRSITVKVDGQDDSVPAFVSVGHTVATQASGEGYRSFSVVTKTPDLHEEAVNEVLSRLESYRRRYESLAPLAPVWDAIDQVREQTKRVDPKAA